MVNIVLGMACKECSARSFFWPIMCDYMFIGTIAWVFFGHQIIYLIHHTILNHLNHRLGEVNTGEKIDKKLDGKKDIFICVVI